MPQFRGHISPLVSLPNTLIGNLVLIIVPGIFMNYFGSSKLSHSYHHPCFYLQFSSDAPSQNGQSPVGHLNPLKFVIDVESGTAQIPGTGDAITGFTEISDVGRGAAAACALESAWEPKTGWMVGDVCSYNDVLKIAEEVRGVFLLSLVDDYGADRTFREKV
jgi:hypothetical protein